MTPMQPAPAPPGSYPPGSHMHAPMQPSMQPPVHMPPSTMMQPTQPGFPPNSAPGQMLGVVNQTPQGAPPMMQSVQVCLNV